MNVLFVNVSADWRRTMGPWRRFSFTTPPPWICFLAKAVCGQGHRIGAIDQNETGLSSEALFNEVTERRPDVLAVSLLTPSATPTICLLRQVRERLPRTKIVLGTSMPVVLPKI